MGLLKKVVVIWSYDRDRLIAAGKAAIIGARASGGSSVAAFGMQYQEFDEPGQANEDEDWDPSVNDLFEGD